MTTPNPSVPVISVYNQAKTPLGLDLEALVAAMQHYLDYHVLPVWGLTAVLKATSGPVKGTWGMVFLENSDAPGALAYHDEEGNPLAKVFVATTLEAHESLSVSASHELAEMLGDPACNRYAMSFDGSTLYALELCDAVEEASFKVDGFDMSDFCYPAWFDPTQKDVRFSQCWTVMQPFKIASGGYAITCAGGNISQTFGSRDKAARFAREDRRGHRSEYRRAAFKGFGES